MKIRVSVFITHLHFQTSFFCFSSGFLGVRRSGIRYSTTSSSFVCNQLYGDTLILGDGDFSFSKAFHLKENCKTLTTTTLDSPDRLFESFANAASNVNYLNLQKNVHVLYHIDATNFSIGSFDTIIWNFPHVIGKQNIKYNRDLLLHFLSNSFHALRQDGNIIVTLCEGQSGTNAKSVHDWNFSWKLTHQVAEAGLMLTSIESFHPQRYPGYSPCGHRGHGLGFPIGNSQLFNLRHPQSSVVALQAPLYFHEVHFHGNIQLLEKYSSINQLEDMIRVQTQNVCNKYHYPEGLWAICYGSLTKALSRQIADVLRGKMEDELPDLVGLKPRIEKHGGKVSAPLPWFVADKLKNIKLFDDTLIERANRGETVEGQEPSCSIFPKESTIVEDSLNSLPLPMTTAVSATTTTTTTASQSNEENDIQYIESIARVIWKRRIGILLKS